MLPRADHERAAPVEVAQLPARELHRHRGHRRPVSGDAGLGPHALAGSESVLEQAVDDPAAGAERQGEPIRTSDLSLDLGLPQDHGVERRRHAEEMTRSLGTVQRADRSAELLGRHPSGLREPGCCGPLRVAGVARHEVELGPVAGRQRGCLVDLGALGEGGEQVGRPPLGQLDSLPQCERSRPVRHADDEERHSWRQLLRAGRPVHDGEQDVAVAVHGRRHPTRAYEAGEKQREGGAGRRAPHGAAPAVGLGDRVDDREAQAHAFPAPRPARIGTCEALEDRRRARRAGCRSPRRPRRSPHARSARAREARWRPSPPCGPPRSPPARRARSSAHPDPCGSFRAQAHRPARPAGRPRPSASRRPRSACRGRPLRRCRRSRPRPRGRGAAAARRCAPCGRARRSPPRPRAGSGRRSTAAGCRGARGRS